MVLASSADSSVTTPKSYSKQLAAEEEWVLGIKPAPQSGGKTLNKPTHFETRDGKF